MMWIRILQIVLVIGMIGTGVYAGSRMVDEVALEIMGPSEPELGLPVYAQFVVTQSLIVSDIIGAKALVVPMYVPVVAQPLYIRLFRNGGLIEEWRIPTNALGVTDVYLPLSEVLLDGNLEVQFDGSDISHENELEAPRVFFETQDFAYPDGNYRIAENHKQGDISLRLIEEVPVWRLWYRRWEGKPVGLTAQVLFTLLGLLFLWQIPRMLGHTN